MYTVYVYSICIQYMYTVYVRLFTNSITCLMVLPGKIVDFTDLSHLVENGWGDDFGFTNHEA